MRTSKVASSVLAVGAQAAGRERSATHIRGCRSPRRKRWRAVAAEQSLEPQAAERTHGMSADERQHQNDERNVRRPKNHHEVHLLHRARNDPCRTYDRWTNLLVRSCWEFLFRWRNLGLLPFRICRRVSVAGVRMAADLGTIVVFELCFTLLGLVPRTRCLRLATAGAPGVC